jgi:hypothetical protein
VPNLCSQKFKTPTHDIWLLEFQDEATEERFEEEAHTLASVSCQKTYTPSLIIGHSVDTFCFCLRQTQYTRLIIVKEACITADNGKYERYSLNPVY